MLLEEDILRWWTISLWLKQSLDPQLSSDFLHFLQLCAALSLPHLLPLQNLFSVFGIQPFCQPSVTGLYLRSSCQLDIIFHHPRSHSAASMLVHILSPLCFPCDPLGQICCPHHTSLQTYSTVSGINPGWGRCWRVWCKFSIHSHQRTGLLQTCCTTPYTIHVRLVTALFISFELIFTCKSWPLGQWDWPQVQSLLFQSHHTEWGLSHWQELSVKEQDLVLSFIWYLISDLRVEGQYVPGRFPFQRCQLFR